MDLNGFNDKRICIYFSLIFLIVAYICMAPNAYSQYQVYQWANFEDGRFPRGSVPYGIDFQQTVQLVDFTRFVGAPPEFHSGIAATETGKFGLQIKSEPANWKRGLAFGIVLDRDRIGDKGRALYQADFFVSPPGSYLSSIAVLAMEPLTPGEQEPKAFYRFGLSKNRSVYFSYVVKDAVTAAVYKEDMAFTSNLPRPGWHRFAIIFEGPNVIRCYVDGHEPAFSPLEEPTLRKLQVGIMLADKDASYITFVDNLSIQWTPEEVPLPESPYTPSWPDYKAAPAVQTPITNPEGPQIKWLDPAVAWDKAAKEKSQLLVYFYAPNIPIVQKFDQIIEANDAARDYLKNYVLAKIDMNQLRGGVHAQKYNIFKVPTLLILNPNDTSAATLGRAIFTKNDTWETFIAKLKK